MPLRITKASDPIEVKNLVLALYSVPGLGKTSLGFTAEGALLLDFDHGAYRSKNREESSQVESWADVVNMTDADLKAYKTVVIDTTGRALDCLSAALIDEDSKNGKGGGGLSLQGYGVLKTRFTSFLRWLRGLGLDVVLLCHADEQRKGDELIERLDIQGGSKNEVYKSADVMGRLYMDRGKRILNFSPTDTAFGKNPGQLPPLTVPDFATEPRFLAGVIAGIKASLNKLSAEQLSAQTALTTWAERITAASTCSDFDALVALAQSEGAPKSVGLLVAKAAKAKGLAWNKGTKAYDLAESKAA